LSEHVFVPEHDVTAVPVAAGDRDQALIVAEGLVKVFGRVRAVDGLSFHVAPGECLGILGPNGAGKTTTIKMLSGQAPMDSGRIQVAGRDIALQPRAVRQTLGLCPQEDTLDTDFDLESNLVLYASYFGIGSRQARHRARELLHFVQLWERRHSDIRTLSGGMKRRLLLARSLVNDPRILILDEPTTGLDPQARHQVWSTVDDLKRRGITILLTTHYMDEAERLCDRVLIVDQGHIISEGSPQHLIRTAVGSHVVEAWGEVEALARVVPSFKTRREQIGRRLYLFPRAQEEIAPLLGEIEGIEGIERVIHRPASLEDVFLRLTGRELRE
jgi:lipooligosaccharide transport system ATP-binding protein